MVKAHFNLKSADILLRDRGLQDMGPVQKYIDGECIRLMEMYTPRLNGALINSASTGSVVGGGVIQQAGPYAHYLYEGILFVSSVTGSSWAKKDEIKVPTGKALQYYGGALRGKKWFERMVSDHKEELLKGAQEIAGKGA